MGEFVKFGTRRVCILMGKLRASVSFQVQDVFGVSSASQIDVEKSRLDSSRDSPVAQRVRDIVDILRYNIR